MRKKIITLVAVLALALVAVIGGSLAYFTDTDAADNVFTTGNVNITLKENFDEEGAKLLPGVENAITKEVSICVEEGSEDAYVWYTYLVPTALLDVIHIVNSTEDDWTYSKIGTEIIDEIEYTVFLALYSKALSGEEETVVAMSQVYMDSAVDADENGNYTLNGETIDFDFTTMHIFVRAYAIQAAGFDGIEAAYAAYVGE